MNNNMNVAHAAAILYVMSKDTETSYKTASVWRKEQPAYIYETPKRSKNKSQVRIPPAPKMNKALRSRGKRDPVNPIPFRI